MVKKILSLTVAIMLFSVTALAVVTPVTLAQASEEPAPVWADGTSKIESLAIGDNTHLADLEQWDGTVADSLQGAGTEASPYQISNGRELAKFAAIVNGGEASAWAVLTSDIHMGNHDFNTVNWKNHQIGRSAAYTGTFDGKGYSIYNLCYQTNGAPYHGLFGTVSGTVKNFKLLNILYTNTAAGSTAANFGGVCSNLNGGTIDNVVITGEFRNNSSSAKVNLFGGIAGRADGAATITNCYSALNIDLSQGVAPQSSVSTAAQTYGVGGILGTAYTNATVTVTNCGFGGEINAPLNHRVAGIVGNARGTYGTVLTIDNCYNTGNITGNSQVAGILGWINTAGAFATNAYNTGTIVARNTTTPWASGIANNVSRVADAAGYFYSSGDVQVKETADAADSFNGVYAGLLFTKNEAVSGYNLNSQHYYVSSSYTYEAPDTSEGAEAGATVTTQKNAYGCNNGGKSAGNKFTSNFALTTVLNFLNTGDTGAFAADIGINGGKPVLGWQVNNLQLLGSSYEINAEKPMTVSLAEPGYFQVEVISIAADNTEIVLTDAQGNDIETKKAGKMGATTEITINSGDATEVQLTTTGRAVITKSLSGQVSGTEITQLTNNNSKIYKVNLTNASLSAGEEAVIIFVHYDSAGTIKSINYNEVTADTNAIASAIADLSGVTVRAGDYLKAYFWAGGTLAPFDVPAQLNQKV